MVRKIAYDVRLDIVQIPYRYRTDTVPILRNPPLSEKEGGCAARPSCEGAPERGTAYDIYQGGSEKASGSG